MSGIKNVGLSDVASFGRNRGKTFQMILEQDPSWLCWLRDQKMKDGVLNFFSLALLKEIDKVIGANKALRTQGYRVLNLTEYPPSKLDKVADGIKQHVQEQAAHELAYSENWGAF